MWKDILLGKGEKKKVEEEKGVKESGWSRREKYKGPRKRCFLQPPAETEQKQIF